MQDVVDEQIFPKDAIYSLSDGRLVENTDNSGAQVLASRIQDGDLIFYLTDSEPPTLQVGTKLDSIELGKGLYLISAFDAYREYEVRHASFFIRHLSNGVYFIDTRGNEIRIFSMTALLQLGFIATPPVTGSGTASSATGAAAATDATQIEIFPSEYLSYDPTISEKLTQADIFRVGQLTDF